MTLEFNISNTFSHEEAHRPKGFYVYVILNPVTFIPIYVGKGSGARYLAHWLHRSELNHESGRFNSKNEKLRSLRTPPRYFIDECISQDEAFTLETDYIKSLEKYYEMKLTNVVYRTGDSLNVSKSVIAFNSLGTKVGRYSSIQEAGFTLGVDVSCISSVCKGKMGYIKDYTFIYESNFDETKDYSFSRLVRLVEPVIQLSLRGSYLNKFENATKASQALGYSNARGIQDCVVNGRNSSNGFIWVLESNYNSGNYNVCVTNHIIQTKLDNSFIKIWNSVDEAQRTLKVWGVSAVCKNHRKSSYGFSWWYLNDYVDYLTDNNIKIPIEIEELICKL